MSKKISIGIVSAEELKFKILEDAHKDDYFELREVTEIDFSSIQNEINLLKDKIVNKKIEEAKKNWMNEFLASPDYKKKDEEIFNLKSEKKQLESSIDSKIKIATSNAEKESNDQINKLKAELQNYDKNKKTEIDLAIANAISKSKEENLTLTSNIKQLEENQDLKIRNELIKQESAHKIELQKKESEFENKLEKKESEFKNKLEEIERGKPTNSKVLGTELEQWIQNEYNKCLANIENCELIKTTTPVDGTMPDFLFAVKNKNNPKIIQSVAIEAKTQSSLSEDKIKNQRFYSQLEKNRIKNKSQFSLLVTELEPNEVFSIKRIGEYENMYMCRPQYFVTFLTMIRFVYMKYDEIEGFEPITFQGKKEILENFEDMKNDILNKTIKNINTNAQKIIEESEKIQKLASSIMQTGETIVNAHVESLKKKIDGFRINKIVKTIDPN